MGLDWNDRGTPALEGLFRFLAPNAMAVLRLELAGLQRS